MDDTTSDGADGDDVRDAAWRSTQIERATAILHLLTRDTASHPVAPDPDAAEWGARAAVARAVEGSSALIGIYLFDGYWQAREIETRLAECPPEGKVAVTDVNGPLLLWATADEADADGGALLFDVQSSFAGDE